jgi:hypothetical protein
MAPAGLARELAFRASRQVVGGPHGPGRLGSRARLPGEQAGGWWPAWPRQAWLESSPSGRAGRWLVAMPVKPEARAEGIRQPNLETTRSPSARASGFPARAGGEPIAVRHAREARGASRGNTASLSRIHPERKRTRRLHPRTIFIHNPEPSQAS